VWAPLKLQVGLEGDGVVEEAERALEARLEAAATVAHRDDGGDEVEEEETHVGHGQSHDLLRANLIL
jgi:hypothetical protein